MAESNFPQKLQFKELMHVGVACNLQQASARYTHHSLLEVIPGARLQHKIRAGGSSTYPAVTRFLGNTLLTLNSVVMMSIALYPMSHKDFIPS